MPFLAGKWLDGRCSPRPTSPGNCDSFLSSNQCIALPFHSLAEVKEQAARTSGIEVTHVNHGGLEIAFWDLAGHKEFHALHDVFMPNQPGPSLFLLVCSLVSNQNIAPTCKTRDQLSSELKYWLRYISSNTKHNSPPSRAQVILVFTHLDKLAEPYLQAAAITRANNLKDELGSSFAPVASVQKSTFFVDSRHVGSVSNVVTTFLSESKKICYSCEDIYKVCDDAKRHIAELIRRYPHQVWLTKHDLVLSLLDSFFSTAPLEGALVSSQMHDVTKALVHHLHQTGSVVYFKECDMIMLNLQWFCKDFMGSILEKTTKTSKSLHNSSLHTSHNGFWERGEMNAVLESILYNNESLDGEGKRVRGKSSSTGLALSHDKKSEYIEQLISIMKQLDLCFEIEDNGKSGLFLPATLNDKEERKLRRWSTDRLGVSLGIAAGDFGYVGYRLMCEDEDHTFLTPGIFPRLQVHLRKVLETACYQLEKDIIKSVEDCMEVIIEFNEVPLSFIDIMVRFPAKPKQQVDVFKFIKKVVRGVRDLQRESGCWSGVQLIEAALRPSCVEGLVPPEHKEKEFATFESLRGKIQRHDVVADFESITYTWGPVEAVGLQAECVPAISLLGERAFSEIVLQERILKVEELSKSLGIEEVHMMTNTTDASSRPSIPILDTIDGQISAQCWEEH
ncbi:hypothetical protein GOP47_0005126 [Adiantum capillus-veneris]|uniref:Uncharacterized protein n=1 Tax=Adiantum capillus-veneris TaxID=13818 RepID=A0A9D4V662_ADICA|nr:hypothetical protein GOP47_0005126 [Adiantum capillus-veneris]